nr:immunoglobulin heavy chain junction region [Mus musculus]
CTGNDGYYFWYFDVW